MSSCIKATLVPSGFRSTKGGPLQTTFLREHQVPVTPVQRQLFLPMEPRSVEPSEIHKRTTEKPSATEDQSTAEFPPDTSEAGSVTNGLPRKKSIVAEHSWRIKKALVAKHQQFLDEYPKRTTQPYQSLKLWRSLVLQPETADDILADIRFRKTSSEWTKEKRKNFPSPHRYLARNLWLHRATLKARLEYELERHPGNQQSIYHDPQASSEVTAGFEAIRARLNKLKESR